MYVRLYYSFITYSRFSFMQRQAMAPNRQFRTKKVQRHVCSKIHSARTQLLRMLKVIVRHANFSPFETNVSFRLISFVLLLLAQWSPDHELLLGCGTFLFAFGKAFFTEFCFFSLGFGTLIHASGKAKLVGRVILGALLRRILLRICFCRR